MEVWRGRTIQCYIVSDEHGLGTTLKRGEVVLLGRVLNCAAIDGLL